MNRDYVVIDKKVVDAIIHHTNHLSLYFVPEPILDMSITLTTGQEVKLRELIDQARSHVDIITNYLKATKGR